MPFKSFGLNEPLVRGIQAVGYTAPTKIQSQAIPAALDGHDLIGCAQTGTGKTAAFVLPILNRLSGQPTGGKRTIKSLILAPTRELAMQIDASILTYGRFLNLRSAAIYGGVNIDRQLKALRRGVDIVVATPGRLMDHMQRGSIDLRSVDSLVLDEADRMLDMGFVRDVRKIVSTLPQERQTFLFSATISSEIETLSAGMQRSPQTIKIDRKQSTAQTVTQCAYRVEKKQKIALLLHMLETNSMYSVLVFSRTKHGADKIRRKLERAGVTAVAIHSNRSQNQRQRALEGFKRGKFQVMVATDIAARGIDVEGITHVINFDVPAFAEDYVHRIGRTGRAEATGEAISFVSGEEKSNLRKIEKFIKCRVNLKTCPGFVAEPPSKSQESPTRRQDHGKPSKKKAAPKRRVRAVSSGPSRKRRRKRTSARAV